MKAGLSWMTLSHAHLNDSQPSPVRWKVSAAFGPCFAAVSAPCAAGRGVLAAAARATDLATTQTRGNADLHPADARDQEQLGEASHQTVDLADPLDHLLLRVGLGRGLAGRDAALGLQGRLADTGFAR